MAMPVNMILVMYVILCILSYDFSKLTMLYIHVHISISMTNKSGLTFFLSIKYLSVCGNVASVLKAPFISYSRMSYFGHARQKLYNFVFISRLTYKINAQHKI